MHPSAQCVELVRRYESFSARPYLCPAGVWTIGYGHTSGVGPTSSPITEERASALLRAELESFAVAVFEMVKTPINQAQFDALCSFAYNLGSAALRGSTLIKRINAGDMGGAAEEFSKWVKAGGKTLPGLVRRRADEKALFMGTWG
jgi:lysozyme